MNNSYTKIKSFEVERKKSTFIIIKRNSKYTLKLLELVPVGESKYFKNIKNALAVGINGKISKKIENKEVKDATIIIGAYINEDLLEVREAYWHEEVIEETLEFNLVFQSSDNPSERNEKKVTYTVIRKKQDAILKITVEKNKNYQEARSYHTDEEDFGIISIQNIANNHAHNLEVKNLSFVLVNQEENSKHEKVLYLEGTTEQQIKPNFHAQNFALKIRLSELAHPIKEQTYTILISGEKRTANDSYVLINPMEDVVACSFSIKPNKKETDLIVWINENDETAHSKIKVENVAYDLKSTNTKIIADIQIGNRSDIHDEHNTDYLEIKNLSVSKVIDLVDKQQDNEGFKNQLNEVISILYKYPKEKRWKDISEPKATPVRLENGQNSLVQLKIQIDPKDCVILDPRLENKANIKIVLSFDYSVKDKEGRHKFGKEDKNYVIDFEFRQYEGDNWLAIDYGTSAIVAQYGSVSSNNLESKLKSQFKKLIENQGKTYIDEDYDETHESLLSSTISLRTGKSLTGNFLDSVISISPKLEGLSGREEFLLPYLKSLVGHERLPEDYLRLIPEGQMRNLLPLNIIEETYIILLNDLVVPAYKDIRKNKIILTIPNSFTTYHTEILRNIIKNNFEDVWEDYIVFVSESDAVAWYYLDHSFDLLQHADDLEAKSIRKREKLEDETVLIYDMGAGTLDITLFRIQKKKGGNKKVKILGKIGQISGGNYADYVLGEEYWKQMENENEEKYNPMRMKHVENYGSEKIKYRTFIRNVLKPALNSFDQSEVTKERFYGDNCIPPEIINFEKIIRSEGYTNYLTKNTATILSLLKSTFGLGDSIRIDTLVLSGRGVQLKGLKEALQSEIAIQFANSKPLTIQIPSENLKTIVSEGAIYHAIKRNSSNINFEPLSIKARYGILMRIGGGEFRYEEILNSDAPPPKEVNFDGIKFKGNCEYRELGTLSDVEQLTVIQTYLQKDQIINYLNDTEASREASLEKYHQSSSHITSFISNRDFSKRKNKIEIAIDVEGEIYIRFNNNVKTRFIVPSSDLENSEFFKKPMWYLF